MGGGRARERGGLLWMGGTLFSVFGGAESGGMRGVDEEVASLGSGVFVDFVFEPRLCLDWLLFPDHIPRGKQAQAA